MIVFFLEVTQKLALRTLASHHSCGDVTLKLGTQRASLLNPSKCLLSSGLVLFKKLCRCGPLLLFKEAAVN